MDRRIAGTETTGALAAAAVGVLLAVLAVPAALPAQAPTTLSGEVLDSETGAPLPDAVVTLRPLTGDSGWSGAAPSWAERTALTDAEGRYRFEGLPPGPYSLDVARLGFRSARLRVEMRSARESRVAVGLEIEPIALEPVSVGGPAPAPYDRGMAGDAAGAGQVAAAELRQRRYLASDVWSLTHADLLGAVTLGESDLFRALQRLPGVSTRDDWTAELWTRGSAWDHTRVYFDGLPLFNPVHGGGVFSGVNSDAVGAVYLHPGVRPAAIGEGVTALELRSRPAGGAGELRGFGELSLASARVAADQRIHGGRGGWMLAARRTYLDWLSSGIGRALDVEDASIPYRFTDVTARYDAPLGGDRRLEASVLWEADRLTGDIPDVVQGSRVVWGNLGARATVETRPRGLVARHTVGFTSYGVDVDSIPPDESPYDAERLGEIHHDLRYWVARGELAPAGGTPSWSGGYELVHQSMRAFGETPPMYLDYRTTRDDTVAISDELTAAAAWVDRRWTLGRLELDTGLRVDGGTPVSNGGAVRLSPRVLARLRAADGVTITAAAGRTWQYTQMLTPIGFFRADFPSGHLWLMAGEDTPALRSDLGSLGGEVWLGEAWLASATVYVRRAGGVILPDPRPGITLGRPLYVVAEEAGRGLELGLRRLRGRITGSMAYTLASAEHSVDDLTFPTGADRRHLFDVTALARVGRGVRLGAAYTYAAGAPYTRVTFLEVDEEGHPVGVLGAPNVRRMPSYSSVDLMLEWMKRFDAWSIGAYLQLRNALGRENSASYEETLAFCPSGGYVGTPEGVVCEPGGTEPELQDQFLMGFPRLPLLGLRVEF